nr:protein MtfA-like [Nerophis lumbriciformis]
MLKFLRRWRRRRILKDKPVSEADWQAAVARLPLIAGLDLERQARIRAMATWFLDEKDFYPSGGIELTEPKRLIIAAQACMPVVDLGYHWLDGWYSIYVYPGLFRTRRATRNTQGLVSEDTRTLSGEASSQGGIVLSWDDIEDDIAHGGDGESVIIHEIAHKLDMRNGPADGYPPLHRHMRSRDWAGAMQSAFDDLKERASRREAPIDPYGATNPAEFFAVSSEYYFERPQALRRAYPDVFQQLVQFYRNNAMA